MLLRAQILCISSILAGVAATRSNKNSLRWLTSLCGASHGALPTSRALQGCLCLRSHRHSPMHPSKGSTMHTACSIHGCTDSPRVRIQGPHTAHSTRHQELYHVGFGPSAAEILLCRFYSLGSQHTDTVTLRAEPWLSLRVRRCTTG